jgi:hypothetical protein
MEHSKSACVGERKPPWAKLDYSIQGEGEAALHVSLQRFE